MKKTITSIILTGNLIASNLVFPQIPEGLPQPPPLPDFEFAELTLPAIPRLEPITKVDLSDGLIAHYSFSGNTKDQSGNQNNLENRGASLTEDR
ncbi:MAG: hypothetical protein VXX28_02480, partial [Verrucomicrobiota bacterium]|nr:hypothetical protein [Verrucomicrobiota bacterium]